MTRITSSVVLFDSKPIVIGRVRQGAKREKAPDVLDAEELRKLLAELETPARALVFLTAATGLRVSEALGVKRSDVEFGTRMINLSRAVVHQHVGEMKTEASQKPVPMAGALANALLEWSGTNALSPARRLGIRKPENEWQATLLAGNAAEVLRAARRQTLGYLEEDRLAHLPQDFRNPSHRKQ